MKPMKLFVSVGIIVLFAVSCTEPQELNDLNSEFTPNSTPLHQQKPPEFALGDTLTLKAGEAAIHEEERLLILFDTLLSDSRCPAGVQCIWAGNASVRLIFESGNEVHFLTLNTHGGFQFPTDTTLIDYHVLLTGVLPYPSIEVSPDPGDYEVQVVILKN